MFKAIIIDDEKNAREFLSKLILRYFPEKIIVLGICDSVSSGVKCIKLHNPELVFLDIQMPHENGFELFKHFERIEFDVIFTTAYKEYAIDAIRHSALDYLLKPISYVDLLTTIKRYEKRKNSLSQQDKFSLLLENIGSNDNSFNKVALPTSEGYELVKINNILFCKSDGSYCKIYCVDGREFILAKTLKYVEELINNDIFVRIHKSYLVNLNYVTKFDKIDEFTVTLTNGEQLPVSVRKKEQFLNAIRKKK